MQYLKTARWSANSVYPDQTPHKVATDIGLHCLHRFACPNTWEKKIRYELRHKIRCLRVTYGQQRFRSAMKPHNLIMVNVIQYIWIISYCILYGESECYNQTAGCTGWSGPSLAVYARRHSFPWSVPYNNKASQVTFSWIKVSSYEWAIITCA